MSSDLTYDKLVIETDTESRATYEDRNTIFFAVKDITHIKNIYDNAVSLQQRSYDANMLKLKIENDEILNNLKQIHDADIKKAHETVADHINKLLTMNCELFAYQQLLSHTDYTKNKVCIKDESGEDVFKNKYTKLVSEYFKYAYISSTFNTNEVSLHKVNIALSDKLKINLFPLQDSIEHNQAPVSPDEPPFPANVNNSTDIETLCATQTNEIVSEFRTSGMSDRRTTNND